MATPLASFDEQKQALAETLLPLCPYLLIDGTQADTKLPEFLAKKDLVLRLGRDARVMGMPDLDLGAQGFSVTLSVRGTRYFVSVPWTAVSRMWVAEPFQGPMVVWPDAAQQPKPPSEPPKDGPKRGPGLRLVKD
jgi:stringent starvation protein B